MKVSKTKLFKQRLIRTHVSLGIIFSLLMYISILFGVFTVFLPYIKTWEKPSRHFSKMNIYNIEYNEMLNEVLKDENFPQNNIIIKLPGMLGDPALQITHRFAKAIAFNPNTKERLDNEDASKSKLADFLNEIHYGGHLKLIGETIVGLNAIGVMALIITGLIMVNIMRFKNKGESQKSTFSKIHVKIFTFLFLPLLLITISGGLMNIGLTTSAPMSKALTHGKSGSIDEVVGTVLFPQNEIVERLNIKTEMLEIKELLLKAKSINPQWDFKEVKLINWTDKTARVEIYGYNPYKPFLNSNLFNRPHIILNASTSELIKNKKVLDNKWPVFVAEILFFLHFLFGIDIVSRIIIALMMLLCSIAIGFGVMLWLEKKASKFEEKIIFYHWMGKLSLCIMIGVLPAIAMLFFSQWILPFNLEDRIFWQQGLFYNTWLFTLFWAFYKINSYDASRDFFRVSGLLFIFSVIAHIGVIDFKSITLVNILSVDIGLSLLGIIFIYISIKLPRNRNEAKLFWSKKDKKDKYETSL